MPEVTDLFGSFRVNIVAETLADSSDSAFCLTIALVMVSGSHIEINLDVGHNLHPEA